MTDIKGGITKMGTNLEDIANRVKSEHHVGDDETNSLSEFEREEPESVVEPVIDDDDDDDEPTFVMTTESEEKEEPNEQETKTTEKVEAPSFLDDDDLTNATKLPSETMSLPNMDSSYTISDEDMKDEMPDVPDNIAEEHYERIRTQVLSHRQALMIKNGLSEEDANFAANGKMRSLCAEVNINYLKKNPRAVTVKIDKTRADDLSFSEDEKNKMIKAEVIKLEIVDKKDVERRKIRRVPKEKKLIALQGADINSSQYSVPLPILCDYVRFKGAQIIELANAISYDDATPVEATERKAQLIYNQLLGGSVLQKYDSNQKLDLSYNEFINKFLFNDIDMALYAILVASSMEETETTAKCGHCQKEYDIKYNIKKLLTQEGMSDAIKEKFEEILAHKADVLYLKNMSERENMTHELKSPLTGNIYAINYPTIARVIDIYRRIDPDNQVENYRAAILMYIDHILVYDKVQGDYIPVDEDEIEELLTAFRELPQDELNVLMRYLKEFPYNVVLKIESKCDKCGQKSTNELSVDQMVFLRAQDTLTEIQ